MSNLSRTVGVVVGVAAVAALATVPAHAAPAAPARFAMPALSGRYPVGTTDLHLVDRDRVDPWNAARQRELMVTVSYPAAGSDGPRADWMGTGVAQVADAVLSSEYFLDVPIGSVDWDGTTRQARTNVRVAAGEFPVVLFSHGWGGARELNAGVVDDLASHGYVVVSLSHTYESLAVGFPGGRVEYGVANEAELDHRKTAIDTRVADSRFVLDQLALIDRGRNPDAERDPLPRGLDDALDLSRTGMFGHSYGGYTAGEAMYADRRIDAGIDVDGAMAYSTPEPYFPGEAVRHGLDRPFLLFGGDFVENGQAVEHSHRTPEFDRTWADFWARQRAWKRDLHLDRATHYSFTDLQVAVPQLSGLLSPRRQAGIVGTIDPRRSLAAQHDYVAGFFDLHLKRRDRGLFHGPSPRHPDARFIV
ncbi:alpha/beta hydrolase family protein [Saccharothrix violaceirubra]|uniref:Putative dienelactone hydrolase n=1 Tax=Saccharothrix violaceirubra TaxID=413306 RepID=A0A7W7T720_9PSEU|nr:lipase [Saccharothrix violaceirubra]MBB4967227.1 putative dienelactone hydrolase [Saccharothrix violaceirubra]